MNKLKFWLALGKLKDALERCGVAKFPLTDKIAKYVKQRWFGEFDEQSLEGICVNLKGLKVYMPPRFTRHYFVREYEPVTQRVFLESVRAGDVVVDVGAHIGYFSLLAAKVVGETGKVYAVEPCQETVRLLEKSIHANSIRNLAVHCCAAGNSQCLREFNITGSSDSHGFYRHPNTETLNTVQVKQEKVDSIVEGRVNVAKIDVEGAEIEVLEGMENILMRNHDIILFVEWFPAGMKSAGRDPSELPERLRKLNFMDIRVIDDTAESIRPVDEVISMIRKGLLPPSWYANLWARRG
jgi:FkbM family methyltransferase